MHVFNGLKSVTVRSGMVLALVLCSTMLLAQRYYKPALAIGTPIGMQANEDGVQPVYGLTMSLTWDRLNGGPMITYFNDQSTVLTYNVSFDAREIEVVYGLGAGDKDMMLSWGGTFHKFSAMVYYRIPYEYGPRTEHFGIILQFNITRQG